MTERPLTSPAISQLVLSVFSGIDLLGRGFEAEGFCVVRAPEKFLGGDVRDFHTVTNRFDGIIAGSPCQDFSQARRSSPTGEGVALLDEFARVVLEAAPEWWLLENVPSVPDVAIEGYQVQRFDLNARECGGLQRRLRHFQFGSKRGLVLVPERRQPHGDAEPVCLASEGTRKKRRSFADFCALQGLPQDFTLEGFTVEAKYKAVGNGVHVGVARTVARAIRDATCAAIPGLITETRLCACNCGRILTGRQQAATPACRKRLERTRHHPRPTVSRRRSGCAAPSQLIQQ